MSLPFYHIIHLFAVMVLFIGTGTALAAADNVGTRKFGAMLRGVALLLLVVTGFGSLAKLQLFKAIPLWAWLKVLIWASAMMLPVFVKRKLLSPRLAVFVALALGGVAACLGHLKPVW